MPISNNLKNVRKEKHCYQKDVALMNNHLSYPNIEPDTSAMVERDGLQNVVDEFNRSGKDIAAGLVNQRIAEPTIETAIQEAMQGLIGGTYSVDEATQHIQDAQGAL